MKALVSVYDKVGIVELALGLKAKDYELISTGGSAKAINSHENLSATEVAEITGFSEMLDGRVKTLHPHIHGGILAKRNDPSHIASLSFQGISTIDLVAVNLYPFEKVAQENPEDLDEIIEKKLEELDEADMTSNKDIAELLQLAHKMRVDEMKIQTDASKAEQSSIKHQTNVQINDNSTFGEGNYGELMKKLLESG